MKLPDSMSTNFEFVSLNTHLEPFLREQDVAHITKVRYRNALNQFLRWLAIRRITNPARCDILHYKESMQNRGLRASTRAHYLVAIRRFFIWLDDCHLYHNVAKSIKGRRLPVTVHAKDALKIGDAMHVLKCIDRTDSEGKRDAALINMLIRTGMRLIEVQRANIGDIETKNNGYVLWVRSKGADDKDQFVILTENTIRPMLEYFKSRKTTKPNEPLFAALSNRSINKRMTTFSLSRIVKKRLQEAGLNSHRLTAHSLRHTFATLAIKANAPLDLVQLALRHNNPATTQIYTRDIQQENRLRDDAALYVDNILPAVI